MPIKRVLYIEDNFQNRRLVKKLLRLNGYEMLEAEDGLEGIAIAAREHPDLILMDINLPGIDGMEAISRLKSSADLGNIPIVALTAVAMRGDRERIIAAGCDGYLQKPIDNVQLINTVRSYIGISEADVASPGKEAVPATNATSEAVATPGKEAVPAVIATGEGVVTSPPNEETR